MQSIGSVREKIVEQSAGVEESHSTINSMIEGISSLDERIEQQVQEIQTSSEAISQMVSGIHEIEGVLQKNSVTVGTLERESNTGREKIFQLPMQRFAGSLGVAQHVLPGEFRVVVVAEREIKIVLIRRIDF